MNAAAQNALLKSIEEPPPHARFVLLCENRSMLLPENQDLPQLARIRCRFRRFRRAKQLGRPAAGGQEERLTNRLTCEQAICAAEAAAQAAEQARRNVSVPLLCACMVERIKAAVGG